METYIIFTHFDGSAADMDLDSDDMDQQFNRIMEAVGAKLVGAWFTLGQFDQVFVVEVPNSNSIRALVSCFPSFIHTQTARAFPGPDVDPDVMDLIKKALGK